MYVANHCKAAGSDTNTAYLTGLRGAAVMLCSSWCLCAFSAMAPPGCLRCTSLSTGPRLLALLLRLPACHDRYTEERNLSDGLQQVV